LSLDFAEEQAHVLKIHGLGITALTTRAVVTKQTIDLDKHRGMTAQKATELRRLLSDVEANEKLLRQRQAELEEQLLASPALIWEEAAEKARYLLSLYAGSLNGQDPRRQMLIARVLEDFVRLSSPQGETDTLK
jgi:hypothetical protein